MRTPIVILALGLSILSVRLEEASAQVLESDSLALVALYDSTDGPNWVNAPTWLSGPVTDWEGVSTRGGRVTQLRLLGFNMTGVLPAAVAELDSLQVFWVSNNNLQGGFPSLLIDMPVLSSIDLVLNEFVGPIPSELGQMTQLTRLALSRNGFTGTIPEELSALTELQSFMVSDNNLSGEIPAGIWELPNLVHLQMYQNDLSGTIPESIGDLTGLQSLLIDRTSLSGPIPESIGNLTALGSLWLGGGAISGTIPPSMGNLTELYQLTIQETDLTGPIPSEFGNLTNLQRLTLSMNNLTGPIPPELGNLKTLFLMWIGFNDLEGEIPEELGGMTAIESIRFRANPRLQGPLPWSFTNLENLDFLDLSGTGICIIDNPEYHAWLDSVDVVVPRPAEACAPGVATESESIPDGFGITAAFPNPVASTQTVSYVLAESGQVTVSLFDGLGRRVSTLTNGRQSAGAHQTTWGVGELGPGTYWIELRSDRDRQIKAVVVGR